MNDSNRNPNYKDFDITIADLDFDNAKADGKMVTIPCKGQELYIDATQDKQGLRLAISGREAHLEYADEDTTEIYEELKKRGFFV